MPKIYGLTGGIGSGKSTFATMLREFGATIIDADQVAREAVEPGTPGLAEITEAFGPSILNPDGTLCREMLGDMIFADPQAREKLNAIVHPRIAEISAKRMMQAVQQTQGPIFYEAALLVENEAYQQFAGLVVVTASRETQLARIRQRNGLTAEEAEARVNSQLPLADKERVADYVIPNDGTLDELRSHAKKLMQTLAE